MTRRTTCERLDEALARIDDPKGEGARACLTVYRAAAQAAADASDKRGKLGISLGPLDGAIVTIKDLFDVAGEVTRAGSKLLAEHGTPQRVVFCCFSEAGAAHHQAALAALGVATEQR